MKTISQVIKSLYNVNDINELSDITNKVETIISNKDNKTLLENVVEDTKNIIVESTEDEYKISNIKTILLFSKNDLSSLKLLKEDGIDVIYINSSNLDYIVNNDNIEINQENKKIIIKKSQSKNTVIFLAEKYFDNNVNFILSELKEFGFLIVNDVNTLKAFTDKSIVAQLLTKQNIAQPKWVTLTSSDCSKDNHDGLDKKIKSIYGNNDDTNKFIVKVLEKHNGRCSFVCTQSNILSICQCAFKLKPETRLFVQEFKEVVEGMIRVNVVTVNNKQEIINTSLVKLDNNNVIDDYELTAAQAKLALDAAKASTYVSCAIDILPTEHGDFIKCIDGCRKPLCEDDADNTNYIFYKKLFTAIDKLC